RRPATPRCRRTSSRSARWASRARSGASRARSAGSPRPPGWASRTLWYRAIRDGSPPEQRCWKSRTEGTRCGPSPAPVVERPHGKTVTAGRLCPGLARPYEPRGRPGTCDRRSAVAANDRAAAPGKSGGSAGSEGLMRASLSAVAPGTALRDGLERVLRGNTGGLIVLGSDKTVESLCSGGFVLDVEFTATRLRELCKLDGGIVLSSDLTKIIRAGVQL